ncbi:alkaline phosphatase D [Thermocatellispora tengchongensis]|uniref:Alkaline phosphatase D n=1 Tax=Thermocatellispora tengchongensis TaxID=1073253 RepID=A0A840P0J2_9ACTN|nr:alkaline phosphatase D family protein [Thermocatellispora tengchongensis]MBB5133238.1 alkaline phosphatase D [Thermocatellispora tengchongensis]
MAKLGYPFTLGVASGEPLPDGVILWTRLAPEPLHLDPRRPGGMPKRQVAVRWQVAEDQGLTRVVKEGTAYAEHAWAHSVHVKVEGLRPATEYFYRFSVADPLFEPATSPVGRTKTAPAPDSQAPVRFAVASCQRYEHGHFTAYRHLAVERPDVVFHLGDYIYEAGRPATTPQPGRYVRPLEPPARECTTLHDYRNRYARYRTDPDLRAAHAAAPWIVTWDDHEVEDNYRGTRPADGSDQAAFLRRRTAAYRAYYEHQPLRVRPVGDGLRMYRWRAYGTVADFLVLDARQYRDGADMLGPEQEAWLLGKLRAPRARWKVLVQPVFFAQRAFPGPGGPSFSRDAWDAYRDQRSRIMAAAGRDLVVLSGDVHNNWACELSTAFGDPAARPVGVEFVSTAITSLPPSTDNHAILAANPHIRYFEGHRGYLTGTATPTAFEVAYRVVDFVDRPGAPVSTAAVFGVEDGRLVRVDTMP